MLPGLSLACLCCPLAQLEVGCMEVMGLSVGLGASSDFVAVRHLHIPEPVRRTCRSGLWSSKVSRKREGPESSLLGEEWKCAVCHAVVTCLAACQTLAYHSKDSSEQTESSVFLSSQNVPWAPNKSSSLLSCSWELTFSSHPSLN